VTVPNVSGQDADQAVVTLKNAGLVGIITLNSQSNKPGIFHVITKTVPAAGTSVPKGSQVTMYYQDSKSAAA
jgi:beta-lactam-binding protein with PASTA domain